MECTIYVAKTKRLFNCEVTAQLICVFVFDYMQKAGFRLYAKSRFSHDAAHVYLQKIFKTDGFIILWLLLLLVYRI